MTIAEAHAQFLLAVDKVGDPYLTRPEIDLLLNQASRVYLAKHTSPNPDSPFEATLLSTERVVPFLYNVAATTSPAGLVSYNEIRAGIPPVTVPSNGSGGVPYTAHRLFKFLAISRKLEPIAPPVGVNYGGRDPQSAQLSGWVNSSFRRHNDARKLEWNRLKMSSDLFPTHLYLADGLSIQPAAAVECIFTVLRYPVPMSYDRKLPEEVNDMELAPGAAAVDPEWNDAAMDEVIALAVRFAGLSIRDEDLSNGSTFPTRND